MNTQETFIARNYWLLAYWILFAGWVTGAGLHMVGIHAGFLTNYLSDLTCPPYLYIAFRGLQINPRKPLSTTRWFSQTPELTAASIFIVGFLSEIAQLYKPLGFFAGTYDPWDNVSYALGLVICYLFDKKYGHD